MKRLMSSRVMLKIAGAWLGLGLAGSPLLCSAEATGASALDTVQSFYDTLLATMRRGNELGQSGRFIQLQPVVHSIFDLPFMARMAIGSGWATVSSAQQQLRHLSDTSPQFMLTVLTRIPASNSKYSVNSVQTQGQS